MANVLSVNAGELREVIEFYTTSSVKDEGGGFPESTKTLSFTKMAKVEPNGSLKTYEGSKTEFVETWNVLIRYESGRVPNESMLVKFKGNWFVIKGIENVLSRNLVLKLIIVKK